MPTYSEWCPPCGEWHESHDPNIIRAEYLVRQQIRRCMEIASRKSAEATENEDTQELPRTPTHSASLGRNQEA